MRTLISDDEPERRHVPWANNAANPVPVPSGLVNTTGTVTFTYTSLPVTTNCATSYALPSWTVYTVTS